ncbi:MAG: type I methionyl aminopeptidase [Holosporales bacterium]|jgi:methionyl aminopeptidase|nr:type I methionyl aminopeptidase [Holosporales bacterium]
MEIIPRYTVADFAAMRKAGALAAHVLDFITPHVIAGVTTQALNDLCHEETVHCGGQSATLNYKGYPKATCISLNHVVCHGIPSDRKLVKGDLLNIDVTVILDGWFGDTSRMFYVGTPSVKARNLTEITYHALMRAIACVRPGATLGDIGACIQHLVEPAGYSVVRDFCGHGIGRVFHDAPTILHYGKEGTGSVLQPGMIFTIEPMINTGTHEIKILSDGWTAVTRDRGLSAQFEHTIGVTETSVEIFTLSSKGYTYPPYAGAKTCTRSQS